MEYSEPRLIQLLDCIVTMQSSDARDYVTDGRPYCTRQLTTQRESSYTTQASFNHLLHQTDAPAVMFLLERNDSSFVANSLFRC